MSDLVRDGYDKIANVYLQNRDRLKSSKYIYQLLKYLPKKSTILDLGCGAGVPVDDILLKAGHHVVGIDISPKQIELARRMCRGGEYLLGDIAQLENNEYQVDAVISFYTIFHIQKEKQANLFKVINSFLPKRGMMLVSLGDRVFEGEHLLHGAKMWSSQYGTSKNREMVARSGFEIIMDEVDKSGGENHQFILAQKS